MAFDQIPTSVTIISSGLIGYQGISLTDFTLSSASLIASGSAVEIAGAYFKATVDITPNASSWTAITSNTTAYLTLTASGTAGSQILSAAWTNTAPVWSTSKQGWYASAASVVRVVASAYKNGATSYLTKTILQNKQEANNNDLGWRGEIEKITSGSGNWTVPSGVYKIRVTCVGGGGGGGEAGAAAPGNDGSNGNSTTFAGATTGTGGFGGKGGTTIGGVGGAGSSGGAGAPGHYVDILSIGGTGGGAGAMGTSSSVGSIGSYGGGGSGGGSASPYYSGGGGGGTFISLVTASRIEVTPGSLIPYSVGTGGAGGTGSAGIDGGAGGSGIIIIEY